MLYIATMWIGRKRQPGLLWQAVGVQGPGPVLEETGGGSCLRGIAQSIAPNMAT